MIKKCDICGKNETVRQTIHGSIKKNICLICWISVWNKLNEPRP
jgi:hypothetical protein